jgi:hypothetical protein
MKIYIMEQGMVQTLMYPTGAPKPLLTRKPKGERDGKEQIHRMEQNAITLNTISCGGIFGDVDFIMGRPYR